MIDAYPPHWAKKPISFAWSVFLLIGHIVGSAVIFMLILGIGWVIGFAVDWCNSTHPFQADVVGIVRRFEKVWIVMDFTVGGIHLLAGVIRFAKDLWRLVKK
jgi:hypothetical protein